tara:strand:+ start:163 stop:471 length:309 start_codon:yes stop_codon:yes gene_type:complete
LIDIFKNKPPKRDYKQLKRYQNKTFIRRFSLNLVYDFFKEYPEEKRGRKNFKNKEVQNVKALIYEEIFQKAIAIKADCIGSIKENVSKEKIMITVSFFRKNE